MERKERFEGIIEWFAKNMPDAASELVFASPYQLLVAVMLSAQCTDKRVNMVTPAVFKAWPDARALAKAEVEEILEKIASISYPNSKAKHLKAAAVKIAEEFAGEVPDTIEKLESLPGVGRKTANVVASICFEAPVIAVDTHVFRVAHRLGLSKGKTPADVEKDLTKGIPTELRARAHHWLILHGRYVCTARKAQCGSCGLKDLCKDFENKKIS